MAKAQHLSNREGGINTRRRFVSIFQRIVDSLAERSGSSIGDLPSIGGVTQ